LPLLLYTRDHLAGSYPTPRRIRIHADFLSRATRVCGYSRPYSAC